jgi:DNA-binding NarL/FixJ family response regulator
LCVKIAHQWPSRGAVEIFAWPYLYEFYAAGRVQASYVRLLPERSQSVISVFVVDDHALVRSGLVNIIALEPDLQVVGDGTGALESLNAIRRSQPRVLVVDLDMPTIRGPDFISMAKDAVPTLLALACTVHASYGWVAEAFRRGADGYVLKSSSSSLLIDAIRAVAEGRGFIDPALQKEVVRLAQQGKGQRAPTMELTARELRVLGLAAEGLTNQQIAARVGESVESVKLHLRRSFSKLGATDRASAVVAAVRRGLI